MIVTMKSVYNYSITTLTFNLKIRIHLSIIVSPMYLNASGFTPNKNVLRLGSA